MAIIGAGLKLAKKLLKNKKLQKAINVTTTQTNKLKNAAKAGVSAAGKATVSSAGKAAKAGAKKVVSAGKAGAKKALKATTDAAKKASKVTGAAAAAGAAGAAKSAASATKAGAKKVVEKTMAGASSAGTKLKDVAGKASGATLGGMASGISGAAKSGVASVKAVANKGVDKLIVKAVNNPFQAGMLTQGLIDIPLTVGAVALTASMVKSSTPKESLYDVKKQPDGNFITSFNDPNKNKITSTSQLSSKEMGIVRGAIAGLDAILLSEDPRKERTMFNGYLSLLSKYGVSSVNGKNLSVNIAG